MNNFWNTQSNFTLISIIIFKVVNETSPNLQGSCRNTSRWCLQNYMGNGWELTSELTSKWITFKNTQSNFTLILLITFEVLNQTSPNLQENFTLMSLITFDVLYQSSPNLQGSCRITSQWCLQDYMENGWELTSELTSKWITFKNTQLNFTLISLITFQVINKTPPNLQGSCRNTSRWGLRNYMENGWKLTSEWTSKWITFKNTQSNFTLISLITFEVINETPPNLQGICRITSWWCQQIYMENG